MIISTKTKAFDGDYQIIFSDSFNIYENELTIEDIAGFSFKFIFYTSESLVDKKNPPIEILPPDEKKEVVLKLKDFRNNLGIGTTDKIPILNMKDDKKIFLSIYAKTLDKRIDFLNVTINFYFK